MKSDYIIRSSLPPIEYPNISLGEYFINALKARHPDTIAIVSKLNYFNVKLKTHNFRLTLNRASPSVMASCTLKPPSLLWFWSNWASRPLIW